MKSSIVFLFLLMLVTVTKLNGQNIQVNVNDICPGDPITYFVNAPSGCTVNWTVMTGNAASTIVNTIVNSLTVVYNNSQTIGTVRASFSGTNCAGGGPYTKDTNIKTLTGTTPTLGSPTTLNFCTTNFDVIVGMGTSNASTNYYEWSLPPGWRTISGLSGSFIGAPAIGVIAPSCATGVITVRANSGAICLTSTVSNTLSINITRQGALTLTPPTPTYQAQCEVVAPVTFTAGGLSCVSSYQWTYPSGYTVSSGSNSASIILVPSGTLADVGTVRATATLNCGITAAQDYPITFNPTPVGGDPYISSQLRICEGTSQTFTVQGFDISKGTIVWSYPPSVTLISQNNNTAVFALTIPRTGGPTATITAITTTGCGIKSSVREVDLGNNLQFSPNSNTVLSGNMSPIIGSIQNYSFPLPISSWDSYNCVVTPVGNQPAYPYQWSLISCNISGSTMLATVRVGTGTANVGFEMYVCGELAGNFTQLIAPIKDPRCTYDFKLANANPAKESLTVSLRKSGFCVGGMKLSNQKESYQLKLYDFQGILRKEIKAEGDEITLNVAELKRGLYVLHIIHNDKIEQKRILLE